MPSEVPLPGHDPADHALASRSFDRAMAELGVASDRAAEVRLALERRYQERGRHYHTLDHVAAMARLAAAHEPDLRDPSAVTLAIWYHDAVYRTRRADNEAQSAALCRRELGDLVPADRLDLIERLILATRTHEPTADLPDSAPFVDFDLAILGSEPAVYDAYARAIRKEYRWVPALIYRKRRAEALQRFASRPAIYFTPGCRRLETSARRNLARELGRLGG